MRQVLLIEDEANIAEALRFILSRDGWQVSVVQDGETALAEVARLRPDLVILDFMLPGMSGLEILSALRADQATTALPVLMLTAKGQGRDREAAERAGASAFMTKPFDNSEIRAKVRELLGA
jgi:DNA-binding response OmpR family regulator